MSAPTATVRGTPAGIKLKEGFRIKHTFARNTTLSVWEIGVAAPGIDGGEPVEQTTQHNVDWETMAPRQLKKLTSFTFTAAFDPDVYNQLLLLINAEDTCTETFPDGSTLAYFGYLQKADIDTLERGKQPTMSITVCPTNFDPVGKVEAGPVLTSVSGT